MTNCLLIYPDIPVNLTGSSIREPVAASGYSPKNISTGGRAEEFRAASATRQTVWEWDMGASYTAMPDHFALCRADLLYYSQYLPVSYTIQGAADAAFTGASIVSGLYGPASLTGNASEDFIRSISFNTAQRYWRVTLSTTNEVTHQLSKLYLGRYFDFGKEPTFDYAESFAYKTPAERRPPRRFNLTWRGITNAKKQDFISKIAKYRDTNSVIVWDQADYILSNMRSCHCRIVDLKIDSVTYNNNTISVYFEELV